MTGSPACLQRRVYGPSPKRDRRDGEDQLKEGGTQQNCTNDWQ